VSAAVYYSSLSQDLVFDPESARNETAPGSRRLGVSVDATLRAGDWFTLAASSTYTRATFGEDGRIGTFDVRAGDLLPYVPQWVTRVDMNAKRPIARLWNRVLELRAGGALESLNRRPLPYGELGQDVFLVDTSLGLRFKEVELSLDVTNLLDARWFDGQFVFASNFDKNRPAGRIPQFHVTSGPPRAAFLHLSLTI
jgi:outer membrane receptor protein involved in Fe transport